MVITVEWPQVLADLVDMTPGRQRGVATRIGIQQQAVSAWLRCETWPDGDNITALAAEFNWSSRDLAAAVQASKENPKPAGPVSPTVARINELEERMTGWEEKLALLIDACRQLGVLPGSLDEPPHAERKRARGREPRQ